MSTGVFLLAALAGGLGSVARYLLDRAVSRLAGTRFPWGIVVVNVTGSFALGLLLGVLPEAAFVVGAGFLGGYTTFSTAMLDTVALWRDGERRAAAAHALGTLLASLLAAGAGLALGAVL